MFASEFDTPVDPRDILRTIELAAAKAGVENVGVHTLRHSAAVAWLESGVHIKAVADLFGRTVSRLPVTSTGTRQCDHAGRYRRPNRSAGPVNPKTRRVVERR